MPVKLVHRNRNPEVHRGSDHVTKWKKDGRLMVSFIVSFTFFLSSCAGNPTSAEKRTSLSTEIGADQEYAEVFQEPITIVCPWAPNGSSDINARTIAQIAGAISGQTITVENVTGGGGANGFEKMLKAEADGNTIGIATAELTTLPPQGNVDFEVSSFYPVIRMNTVPACIAVSKEAPYDSLEKLIDYAKAHPGELRAGDVGVGSIWYISAFELEEKTGIKFSHQSYDGASMAAEALKNGKLDVVTLETSVMHEFEKEGYVKVLAIMAEERLAAFPNYPTCKELGVNLVSGSFHGIVCSDKVPEEKKKILEKLFTEVYFSDEYQGFCDTYGLEKSFLDSNDFGTFLEEFEEDAAQMLRRMGLTRR